jgi:ferritin
MNNLQKIIEENEKDSRFQFISEFCNDHNGEIRFLRSVFYDEKDGAESILEFIKKREHDSQLRLIEGFREMVKEKIEMIGEPQGFSDDCTWSKGKKEGFIDILFELNEIK